MGKTITFLRLDGTPCQGFFAGEGKGRPGIVVIQEWWGLNAYICSVVERLASEGFNALAPDLYCGRVAQSREEASRLRDGLDNAVAVQQDIRGAAVHLKTLGSQTVGVVGYCLGGALSIATAVHVPEIDAAVCYYGIPSPDLADPAEVGIPFLGHFATRDTWCTPEAVHQLEIAMGSKGQHPTFYHYEADHAFSNRFRPDVYDPVSAEQAWERTVAFLKTHCR